MTDDSIDLSFSTCPNDTFIFYAMVQGKLKDSLTYSPFLADVEVLNRRVLENTPALSKISFGILSQISNNYALLNCGGALGYKNGPLLIANKALDLTDSTLRIAIPGVHTTANKLLTHFYPQLNNKEEMLFSNIEQAIVTGRVDAGVIIHESRFTYQNKGLIALADMGELWNNTFHLPLPLGAIVLRNDLLHLKERIEQEIRDSLQYAYTHTEEVMTYIRQYAGEMDEYVIKQHISLYVNDFTINMGESGAKAIEKLISL